MCLLRHEDEQAQKALQDKQKFELLMSIANVFVWEYDVGKRCFLRMSHFAKSLVFRIKPFQSKS